ncbi:cytochrome bc1 complex Rieske iron-sulfur subunit [Nocardia otitidiscaviarum]|uniref:Cytochrome bc1 complex Rieske iron-sulfur subunit n=2 Tax=Nocardia otitidiscaviarum TaxID=1823 RepID=A0A516NIK8_9NOCA|nr:ubiquinol-cytochrome c reductase iron-sulfur subunit [Nocardia otitidiscaviarum]MCP9619859.1 ubiquinol-cytochrome c reductase iron-sulfur subunit [Nocardia otitidiscaviarum]QDP78730.1 ubiquinol-cytochrome c reductase iron-sulfur subunit [Nocardia otitidiscaviarum]
MSEEERNSMGDHPTPQTDLTEEQLDALSRDELVELGTKMDGVDVAYRAPRWPVPGTRAEKRAERQVAMWFGISALSAVALIGVFLFWPWSYKSRNDEGNAAYSLYTPLVGLSLGIAVLAIGIAVVLIRKKFIPAEISIQDRHDGKSSETNRRTLAAELQDALDTSTLARRKMITRTAGLGAGLLGIGALFVFVGGMVKNPWAKGDKSPLWVSGWTPDYPGQTVYLRRDTGRIEDIVLVRPEDLDAGAMETVFPWKEEWRGDSHETLQSLRGIRNAVMLIRLRTADAEKAVKRKGQESFNYGDYFAYSKICTHLGCPTSLFEQQTNRILCPCHQSQFSATEWGKPVFGPAARALPQLPITVNSEGYLVANGDFIEPLGPAFWERRS